MRRRDFIALTGAAAAWPLSARAQQHAMPVVGYLYSGSAAISSTAYLPAFRKGLRESGYAEGQNVTIEYRWAEGQFDRLPALAADLVRRQVAVIAAPGNPATFAARAATSTIPIVFTMGRDPVETRLVTSLNRPGGNATGTYQLAQALIAKQVELLHEVVPTATSIGIMGNPNSPFLESQITAAQAAAGVLGLQAHILNVSNDREMDDAFATLVRERIGALLHFSDIGFLTSRRDRLVTLAARHGIPAMYGRRDHTAVGGLMSYDSPLVEVYRIAGSYVGRILKGEKPAELPVQQSTKAELILNLKTAKALGLTFPTSLLIRADEVIE